MARTFKRGKSWYVDYTYRGKRIRKRVSKDKKTAELVLKDIEVRMAKGEFLGVKEDSNITFSEFNEKYLGYCKVNNSPSFYRCKTSMRRVLDREFGDEKLSNIDTEKLENYKTRRLEEIKPSSVNRYISYLQHMFRLAVEWGYLRENPAKNVKKRKELQRRERVLSEDEEKNLISECIGDIKHIVILVLNTGLRKGEVFNLKWEDVDFGNSRLHIRNSKNNEPRVIPLNDDASYALESAKRGNNGEFVFPGREGGKKKEVKTGFNNALRRAGIKDFKFHDLRHTFSTRLIEEGGNPFVVMELMGHKSVTMTRRYSHISYSQMTKAVSNLAQNWHIDEESED